jgi:hypothetical protein
MWLDENVMDHIAPDDLFYNALVTGVRPGSA